MTSENTKLQNEVKEAKKLLQAQRDTRVERQLVTSVAPDWNEKEQGAGMTHHLAEDKGMLHPVPKT
jgi:hypothetical protein